MREVARRLRVSLLTVQRWVARAGDQRLNRVDWTSRRTGAARAVNRVSAPLESTILSSRVRLRDHSDLGEFGAAAIRLDLIEQGIAQPPSIRTIGRVLARRGVLDRRSRVRRPPPPLGWYLPDVSAGRAEVDSFDTVSGLVIRGGVDVEVLNGTSLHGGLISSWPASVITASHVVDHLIARWTEFGRPEYAQFDNATIFQGPHQYRDVVGRVMRLCLWAGVVPVFAPPREPGFQAAVESLNGRWQAKVWARQEHRDIAELRDRSDRYVLAARIRAAPRIERAPQRRPLRALLDLNVHLLARPAGMIIFIRRTDADGAVSVLGHRFVIDQQWLHRLVRSEVDLDARKIRFYALRRREPASQPLLIEHDYLLPYRRFRLRD